MVVTLGQQYNVGEKATVIMYTLILIAIFQLVKITKYSSYFPEYRNASYSGSTKCYGLAISVILCLMGYYIASGFLFLVYLHDD